MDRIDARAERERALLILATAALGWLFLDAVLISPDFQRFDAARQRDRGMQASLLKLHKALDERDGKAITDQALQARELQALQDRVEQAQARMNDRGASLVPADQMTGVLDGVLRRHGQVHLRSLQNLPRTELGSNGGTLLYRHGVELTVEGSFADLLAYCRELEALPQRLLWGPMALSATDYPRVQLQLTLYTLSQDKPWLQL